MTDIVSTYCITGRNGIFIYSRSFLSHYISRTASDAAMYSASVDDKHIVVFIFLDDQAIIPDANLVTYPPVEYGISVVNPCDASEYIVRDFREPMQ